MATKHILLCKDLFIEQIEAFRAQLSGKGDFSFGLWSSSVEKEELRRAFCIVSRHNLTTAQLEEASRLKLFQIPTAGYEQICIADLLCRDIYVGNNGGANAPSVAEHSLMFILLLLRQFLAQSEPLKQGIWNNLKYSNLELEGLTLGIIGMGFCGQALAEKASALGMNIIYTDIRPKEELFTQNLHFPFLDNFAPLEEVLKQADVLSFHVPLTSMTKHMVNERTLKLMKPSAFLINTSRGGIIKEDDLSSTLKEKRISGAALDVFEREPLPQDSLLLETPNLILTPHCGPSFNTKTRLVQNICQNILAASEGQDLPFPARDYSETK